MVPPPRSPVLPIVVSCVWLVGLVPGVLAALFSPMFFDAPDSDKNPYVWSLFWAIISYPIVCVVSVVAVWIVWIIAHHRHTIGANVALTVASCLPLVSLAILAVLFARGS